MRALSARIRRLENRTRQQGSNRVIEFNPLITDAATALARMGEPGGKYLLVPAFSTFDEWAHALRRQQRSLIDLAATSQPFSQLIGRPR